MLIDLLSCNNYAKYNTQIARIVGITPAIYLDIVLSIYEKATRKSALVDERFCILDSSYIEEKTLLTQKEQLKATATLVDAGLLECDINTNVERVCPVMDNIFKALTDTEVKTTVRKKRKISETPTKREAIFNNLKKFIQVDNEELQQAYEDWVDAVCANPKGFLSKKSIQIFQQTVDNFSNHDLDVALKLIEIATVGGYRDATWAIEGYKRQFGSSNGYRLPTRVSANTTGALSDEVF